MNLAKKILLTAFCALSMPIAMAANPKVCPHVRYIQNQPLTSLAYNQQEHLSYYFSSISKFMTTHQWLFMLEVPREQAVSIDDGMNKAKSALRTLRLNHGLTPKPVEYRHNHFVCLYLNNFDYMAVAVTPMEDAQFTPSYDDDDVTEMSDNSSAKNVNVDATQEMKIVKTSKLLKHK